MTDDALKQLLRSADNGVAPPTLSTADLLTAALTRRRRATMRTAVASLAIVGIALVGVWRIAPRGWESVADSRSGSLPLVGRAGEGGRGGYTLQSPLPNPPHQGEGTGVFSPAAAKDSRPLAPPSADVLLAELHRLDREANLRQQVVQAITHAETSVSVNDDAAPPLNDADLVRLEAARSAAMSWQYARLVETEMRDDAAALREYQRVAERFPGTTWAELATHSATRLANANSPSL